MLTAYHFLVNVKYYTIDEYNLKTIIQGGIILARNCSICKKEVSDWGIMEIKNGFICDDCYKEAEGKNGIINGMTIKDYTAEEIRNIPEDEAWMKAKRIEKGKAVYLERRRKEKKIIFTILGCVLTMGGIIIALVIFLISMFLKAVA